MFFNKERRDDLDAVRQLIETGQVTPIVDRIYPLAEVLARCGASKPDRYTGKIPISI